MFQASLLSSSRDFGIFHILNIRGSFEFIAFGIMAGRIDFDKYIDISKLKNKTALITGGVSGLGSGIAATFAEHGAHVTIADINEQRGNEYAKELTSKGYRCGVP